MQNNFNAQPEFQFSKVFMKNQYFFIGKTISIGLYKSREIKRVLYFPKDTLRDVMRRITDYLRVAEVRLWRP